MSLPIELVWDQRRAATVTTAGGSALTVGEPVGNSPVAYSIDELLATAAAVCVMRTCLRCAEQSGVTLLSFTAAAEAETADYQRFPHVQVRAHVVAPTTVSARQLEDLWDQARREAPLVRLLGAHLEIAAELTRLRIPGPHPHRRKIRR